MPGEKSTTTTWLLINSCTLESIEPPHEDKSYPQSRPPLLVSYHSVPPSARPQYKHVPAGLK